MSDVIVSSPPSALEGERLPSPQAGAGGTASFDMPAFFCPPLARTLPLPSELEEEPDAQEAVDTPLSAHTVHRSLSSSSIPPSAPAAGSTHAPSMLMLAPHSSMHSHVHTHAALHSATAMQPHAHRSSAGASMPISSIMAAAPRPYMTAASVLAYQQQQQQRFVMAHHAMMAGGTNGSMFMPTTASAMHLPSSSSAGAWLMAGRPALTPSSAARMTHAGAMGSLAVGATVPSMYGVHAHVSMPSTASVSSGHMSQALPFPAAPHHVTSLQQHAAVQQQHHHHQQPQPQHIPHGYQSLAPGVLHTGVAAPSMHMDGARTISHDLHRQLLMLTAQPPVTPTTASVSARHNGHTAGSDVAGRHAPAVVSAPAFAPAPVPAPVPAPTPSKISYASVLRTS